jgi:hypothetical protein
VVSLRSTAAQIFLLGQESLGMTYFTNYTQTLRNRLDAIAYSLDRNISHQPSTDHFESSALMLLLSEAQGIAKVRIPLSDLVLTSSHISNLDAQNRFYIAVGLAKVGLYDLSLRLVSKIATPWEAPLYR